jgi:hypothetical protein
MAALAEELTTVKRATTTIGFPFEMSDYFRNQKAWRLVLQISPHRNETG